MFQVVILLDCSRTNIERRVEISRNSREYSFVLLRITYVFCFHSGWSFILDRWRGRFVKGYHRLEQFEGHRKTLHLTCVGFLCCLRWNRQRKLDWKIQPGSSGKFKTPIKFNFSVLKVSFDFLIPGDWSSLLLWLPNCNGKRSLRDVQSFDRNVHSRATTAWLFV